MRNITGVIAALFVAVVLAGCHADTKKPAPAASSTAPAPTTTVSAPAPAAAPSDPAADLKQAFAAAYGSAAPAVRIVTRDGQDTTLRYRPAKLIPLGSVSALISLARTDGCHGCYGELAIHYLTRDGAGFKVVGAWPEISDGGSFGEPPDWTVRNDLFTGPAVVASAGGAWQGCTVAYADIIELTPDRPVMRAKRVLITYDDDNNTDRGVDGTIKPVEKDRVFDVDYAGAHARTIRYKRAGDVFDASSGAPGLPSC